MTKLTVAEASKRGYATSLAILQAVQKNWLPADKDADGHWRVDIAALEQLFGRPSHPEPRSAMAPASASPAPAPADAPPTDAPPVSPAAPLDTAEPAAPDEPDESDVAALRAEILRLEDSLARERRHTAALLEVLAGRVLPPVEPDAMPEISGDDDEEARARADDRIDANPPDTVVTSATEDTPEQTATDIATGIVNAIRMADDRAEPASPAAADPEADLADSVAASSDDGDIAVPPLTAPERFRPEAQPPAPDRSRTTQTAAAPSFVWQIWSLMAFVWIGLIGAFYWYAINLGGDLWIIAQWLRDEIATESPQFTAATEAVLRAARDMFAPPAALLCILLAGRAMLRAVRRRSRLG